MAALLGDSMATYGSLSDIQASQRYVSVSGVYQTSGGHGSGALELSNVTHNITYGLSNISRIIAGFNFTPANTFGGSRSRLIEYLVEGNEQVQLEITSSGNLALYRGNAHLGTSTFNLVLGVQYNIGVDVTIDDSAGACEVKVNGNQWLNLTGVDTKRRPQAYIDRIVIRGSGAPTIPVYDLYFYDSTGTSHNSIPTPKRFTVYTVAGDTAQKDFTPTSGMDNYAMVDDGTAGHDGDTTTVTGGLNDEDMYTLPTIDSGLTNIELVNIAVVAKKNDIGTKEYIIRVDPGLGKTDSSNIVLTSSYQGGQFLLEDNPDTGSAFTPAELTATEVGLRVVV